MEKSLKDANKRVEAEAKKLKESNINKSKSEYNELCNWWGHCMKKYVAGDDQAVDDFMTSDGYASDKLSMVVVMSMDQIEDQL